MILWFPSIRVCRRFLDLKQHYIIISITLFTKVRFFLIEDSGKLRSVDRIHLIRPKGNVPKDSFSRPFVTIKTLKGICLTLIKQVYQIKCLRIRKVHTDGTSGTLHKGRECRKSPCYSERRRTVPPGQDHFSVGRKGTDMTGRVLKEEE